jgi:7-carboxy-7-deazaguanine synthase
MKLLELYTSVQGEGPNTGKPIQFIRFAGCNMRCPGWPCDTPQAIFPERYKDEYQKVTPLDLVAELPTWPRHVCLTGGEPFMQQELPDLIGVLSGNGYRIDIFTNGSFDILHTISSNPAVDIVMDWKLAGSGEAKTRLEQRTRNVRKLYGQHIKFVVKDKQDLDEARVWAAEFSRQGIIATLWVGAAWGHISDSEIVDYIIEHELPWRLNVQMHNHIWDPQERYR